MSIQEQSIPALKTVFPSFDGFGHIARPRSHKAKRALDVAAALLLLVLVLPLMAVLSLAIGLDSRGPVLFTQHRVGRSGKRFAIYKFRTMHVLEDGAVIPQATPHDVRITRVGRLMRGLNRSHDPAMIAAVRQRFDTIIAANPSGSLRMPPPGSSQDCSQRWCWSDALFMGPPGWVAFSRVTQDPKYLAFADKEYRATTALLFDTNDALFYRDSSFIGKTGAHGEKIFWSRGNGWVYAGLVQILEQLPPGSSHRSLYETLYLQMSRRIVTVQKANGSWAPSLLDPRQDTSPETSGTGFFTYGLAWGIKAGLLKDPMYRPAANRGWAALLRAVRPDGKLGWVQEPGSEPDEVSPEDTQPYGAGAFLLAGAAMYDLAIEH